MPLALQLQSVFEVGLVRHLRGTRRVQPPDRRCYAFFHPSLIDEPLIFVEVALTKDIPSSIQEILADDRSTIARTSSFASMRRGTA